MAEADGEASNRLLQVLSLLYSRSMFVGYRKPYQSLHPEIAENYLSVTEHPVDLGTMLLECMNGTASVGSIRDGLKNMFTNSVRFNAEDPRILAECRHLEHYAMGVFEETLKIEYDDRRFQNKDFSRELLKKRRSRLSKISRVPLRIVEIRAIECCILSVTENIPPELTEAVATVKNILRNSYGNANIGTDYMTVPPVLNIESFFLGLMETCRILPSSSSASAASENHGTNDFKSSALLPALSILIAANNSNDNSSQHKHVTQQRYSDEEPSSSNPYNEKNIPSLNTMDNDSDSTSPSTSSLQPTNRINTKSLQCALLPKTLTYIKAVDNLLGIVFVLIEERVLRGMDHCSFFLKPYGLVWAKKKKVIIIFFNYFCDLSLVDAAAVVLITHYSKCRYRNQLFLLIAGACIPLQTISGLVVLPYLFYFYSLGYPSLFCSSLFTHFLCMTLFFLFSSLFRTF